MTALRTHADRLIETGQHLTDQSSKSDAVLTYEAYDQFLWAILTSPREELAAFAKLLFDKPYIDLPPPLQVVIFRIVGLESRDDQEELQLANTGIAMYCSPTEEQHATSGIRARLYKLSAVP